MTFEEWFIYICDKEWIDKDEFCPLTKTLLENCWNDALLESRKTISKFEQSEQEPVAVISESAIGLVKLHSNGACLPFGTQLYAAPVHPMQEPVAWRYNSNGDWIYKDRKVWDAAEPLYAAPVDAKAIRAEALEEAAKWFEDEEHPLQPKKVAAAIRRLK